jgi:myo-inositol 2-dehydrogenase / D-chiro-inositol 1-dehydrogenase
MRRKMDSLNRRNFLKATATTAAGWTIIKRESAFGTRANSRLQLAVTGCGHRGDYVGTRFERHTNSKVVALHDYFAHQADALGEKLGVGPERRHVGLDGYRELLTDDVDAVAVMGPPWFHPEQSVAVLEAGKHLFLSKPIAVDVPGCRQIQEAAGKVKGKQSVLVDFQTRNHPLFREAARRVRAGDIGEPVLGHVYYQAGRLPVRAWDHTPMARLRNWVFDIALSGDIIVEQNIHVIDVANWYLGAHPYKAQGTGGRKARTDVGDCWDHYVVTFWYPNNVLVDFSSGQYLKGYQDLCIRVYGSEGTVDSHYGGPVQITGDHPWEGGTTEDIYNEGTVNNIKDFHESVVNGPPLYDTLEESVESNLSAILGRTAAYCGEAVTWDEMYRSRDVMDLRLDLPSDGPRWTP